MSNVKKVFVPFGCGANVKGIAESNIVIFNKYDDAILVEVEKTDSLSNEKLINLGKVVKTNLNIAKAVNKELQLGNRVLCIGGDHSIALGSISAIASNIDNLGVIWVDAHGDMNTHLTTETGHIHGMILAALQGHGHPQLIDIFRPGKKIETRNVVIFGVRDLDKKEQELMNEVGVLYITHKEILKNGLMASLNNVKKYLSNVKNLHISFDLDSINPQFISGVSVPVKSGFTTEEGKAIIEFLFNNFNVRTADIVEFNKEFDKDEQTEKYLHILIELFQNKLSIN